MCSSYQSFHSHSCTQKSHAELAMHSVFLLPFAEHYAWLWLPLCEYPTDTKQHISGATKEHVSGLGLRILFKHWISWNELWVFTCVYYCLYSCGLHIWHSTLLLRICIFIHHFFWPPQNFRFSALDCTVAFMQQPLTAHHQHPLLVGCGRAGQWTIFRTNRWPIIHIL